MPLSPERASRLIERHTLARRSLERSLVSLLHRLWRSTVKDPFDGGQAYEFARRAAAANTTAEKAATRVAQSFTTQWLTEAYDAPPRSVKLLTVDSVRGTPAVEVFDRAPATARRSILKGLDELEAFLAAEARIEQLAETSIALADRRGATETMRLAGVTHWRRMIRPEMSRGGTCGLCIAASTKLYRVENLMPLHDRCWCVVVPAVAGARDVDPAEVLNEEDLAQVHPTSTADLGGVYKAADGSTFGEQLKRTRFQVDGHGELGAVITLDGRSVRGASEAARSSARSRAKRNPDALASTRSVIEGLEARAAVGENVTAEIDFQRQQEQLLADLV